jgi:hypothetical protein
MTHEQQNAEQANVRASSTLVAVLWFLAGAIPVVPICWTLCRYKGIEIHPKTTGESAVLIVLTDEGGKLLADLTQKNVPSGEDPEALVMKRHLAVILGGKVVAAPAINSELGAHVQIHGGFSQEELDSIVAIFTAGKHIGPRLRPSPLATRLLKDEKTAGVAQRIVLEYEIDVNRKRGKQGPTQDEAKLVARNVKTAIDKAGFVEVSVRVNEKSVVEIIVPESEDQLGDVGWRIKLLVSHIDSLELGILANLFDDKQAIDDAMNLINDGGPEIEKALGDAERKDFPPPFPQENGLTGQPKAYDIVTSNRMKSRVTYSWVEIGGPELRKLDLEDSLRDDPNRNRTWLKAAEKRGKASCFSNAGNASQYLLDGALFYSRENKTMSVRGEKKITSRLEYFVLVRNPEFDKATGKEARKVCGDDIVSASKITPTSEPFYIGLRPATGLLLVATLAGIAIPLFLVQRLIRLPFWSFVGYFTSLGICAVVFWMY